MHIKIFQELQLVLQQQQAIFDQLAVDVGQMRQHVSRTRYRQADHPDVDRLEDEVQRVTVRWENICSQVVERLKATELACQILMTYRSSYDNEIQWLDRVEATINNLRKPEQLAPEEYQQHMDMLMVCGALLIIGIKIVLSSVLLLWDLTLLRKQNIT